jgi:hypothetical protein
MKTVNPLDIQENHSSAADKICEAELSYARALGRTMQVSIRDVRFPASRFVVALTVNV